MAHRRVAISREQFVALMLIYIAVIITVSLVLAIVGVT